MNKSKSRIVIIILILLSICTSCSPKEAEKAENFRIRDGITYRMTTDEVKAFEDSLGNADLLHETFESQLHYFHLTVAGIAQSSIEYKFDEDDFLYEIAYRFEDISMQSPYERPAAIFFEVKERLTQSYGEPIYAGDGKIHPLHSDDYGFYLRMTNRDSAYKILDYSEWLIEYDDCWVVIDLSLVKMGGHYCTMAYRTVSHEDMKLVQESIQNDL